MNLFEKVFTRILSEDNVAGGDSSAFGPSAGTDYGKNTEGDARNIFGGVYPVQSHRKKKKSKKKSSKRKKSKKKVNKVPPPSQPAMMTRKFPELLFGPTHNKSSIGLAENAIKTKSKR